MNAFFIFSAKYLLLVPVIILGAYFLIQPRTEWLRKALFAVSGAVLAYVTGLLGGLLYYDPRPFVVGHFTPLIAHAADNGFPSDHALLVSVIAMIGFYWNKKLGAVLWILAIIVAAARVYVGVHHSIDVIGSMIIAIVAVSLTQMIAVKIGRKAELSQD